MIKLISECNEFLKDCGLTYAFCRGHALELFLNKRIRPHSDVDISVFEEDRYRIIEFILSKGWNVYEHKFDWIDNKIANSYLRSINNSDDEIMHSRYVWAIKPGCSFFKIEPKIGDDNIFNYEILSNEQLNFDFIDITFNKKEENNFVLDSFSSHNKNITRELDKAILYTDNIPYLAPEIILFIEAHPEYMKSDYHREKNQNDFNSIVDFLPIHNKKWLMNALEETYPEGLERLEQLKRFI